MIPLDGLPAQTVAPLSASAQVVAPYGGVVTRVLVDEGAAVRQGQALARIQSKDVLASQADLARARTEAAVAAAQARRDATLLAEGIIPATRNEQPRRARRLRKVRCKRPMAPSHGFDPLAAGRPASMNCLRLCPGG